MAFKQVMHAKGVRYGRSTLLNSQIDANEIEALILAWTLLLFRQSIGNHLEYSWGFCETETSACEAIELITSNLSLTANDTVSASLESVQHYLRKQQPLAKTQKTKGRYTLLLNDERAPPDSTFHYNDEGHFSVGWGNIQLQVTVDEDAIWLKSSWREPMGAEFLADYFARSLVEILSTTITDLSTPVRSVLRLGEADQSILWEWNKQVPETIHTCIHQLIAEQVREHPDAEAICSWDGNFRYEEVDRYSTLLAYHLMSLGVKVGDIIPVCFEKSKWTTIAVMAVIKAGAVFVLMDPSQPLQRRQIMADQVVARLILTSQNQAANGVQIVPHGRTFIVDQKTMSSLEDTSKDSSNELPDVPPDSLLYIIFTSGSTGTPKGVMISHTTYSTSALARSTGIGYSRVSRSLDFTSYAFDVSIDSILCTLLRGGCLCIPDDADRVNDLSGAIRRFKVNMVNVTPSVARILDSDIIPSLNSLGIGGESCSAGDISAWGQHTRVVVGYGPAECTIGCTVNPSAAGKPYVSIGSGTGAVIWLVDPENHDNLVPFGAVGELLIEGPIVGQGYLGDPEKTAAAFIHDPKFLLEGGAGFPGRRGRLYKTGDLLQYDPHGEGGFVFVGRKDTQIKLRGQRVELGEIEHHIKNLLPSGAEVIAEIIAPQNQSKESMLVAFISDREAAKDQEETRKIDLPIHLHREVEHLNERLSKVLPVYMIPVWYIGVSRIPTLVSGKTDRKLLRALGAGVSTSLQTAASTLEMTDSIREPQSEAESFLRGAWCQLLGLEEAHISTTHNFFMLGGDSILAMKLVPAVREGGFALTVADVFNHPVLANMASAMQHQSGHSLEYMDIPAFSLLTSDMDQTALITEAAEQCGCDVASIEDIYPCAPMQEVHMAFYTRSKENFVAQNIADISLSVSLASLKSVWNKVFSESAIMRTRIVEFKQHGFMQVVINEDIPWKEVNSSLRDFLAQDKKDPMSPGAPLSRFAIVKDDSAGQQYLVWTAHHAIYDGWSNDLIVEHAEAAYTGQQVSRPAEFKHFIRYLADTSRAAASRDYWRAQLQGATGPQFPSLPSRSFIPDPGSLAEKFVSIKKSFRSEITIATVIRAAWALVASQYTMNDDVVLGETFMGRTIPVPGAELIEGPILATVPVRIHVDRTATVGDYLRSIQEQGTVRAAHDHLGIQHIRRLSPDAQIACEVTMGLVVQPADSEDIGSESGAFPSFRNQDAALEALHFNSYPLMLACSLQKDGFRLLASYDSAILSHSQVKRVLSQLECAVFQLRGDQTLALSEITCLSEQELSDIWETNQTLLLASSNLSRHLSTGDKYPIIQYVPWIVHPAKSELLMPIGAVGELLLEGAAVEDAASEDVAPKWLKQGFEGIPGRQGKLYHTGDLVKYADDLSLIFIGRKESMSNIDGHVVNLEATDSELRRLLPTGTQVSSQLISPKDSSHQTPIVVTFIQESPDKDAAMIELDINCERGNIPLLPTMSLELGRSIITLHKALTEVLPPYAIPSICVPIAKVTDTGEPVELEVLDGIAETVTLSLVTELRRAMVAVRRTISEIVPLTARERFLRSMWGKFLNVDQDQLTMDDNFFRLGGDSIVAMRMVSALRREGYRLSVADIFQHMQLRSMANTLVEVAIESTRSQNYSPFSLLSSTDIDTFLSTQIRPRLANSSWKICDVLPVTDPQQRDVRATVSSPRSSVQYNMLYFDGPVVTSRLIESFQHLVSQHPILRTVFIESNGRILQVVLEDLAVPVTEHDIEGPIDAFCKNLAQEDIEIDSAFVLGQPFIHLFILQGAKEQGLMIRISHAQYDGFSLPELLRQLEMRYRGLEIPSSAPFANLIQYLHKTRTESIDFWRQALEGSSPTQIISPADPSSSTIFMTKAIDLTGGTPDTTLAMLLTAGWATVMVQFLNVTDVTFGGIVSGRDVDVSGADNIMGPCYQYMPIRVKFEPKWTAKQLLDYVRTQYLEGSSRATLGFQDILGECTDWPTNTPFYGSFTNHLNREYFEKMPFADTHCRVDYTIPHPEPSTPPRIVSFAENNKTAIGIEADEDRKDFWEARLEELARIIEGFVSNPQALLWAPDFVHLEDQGSE